MEGLLKGNELNYLVQKCIFRFIHSEVIVFTRHRIWYQFCKIVIWSLLTFKAAQFFDYKRFAALPIIDALLAYLQYLKVFFLIIHSAQHEKSISFWPSEVDQIWKYLRFLAVNWRCRTHNKKKSSLFVHFWLKNGTFIPQSEPQASWTQSFQTNKTVVRLPHYKTR